MLDNINLDTILSDPILLVGASLVILGPLVFLIALYKYVTFKEPKKEEFVIPSQEEPEPTPQPQQTQTATSPQIEPQEPVAQPEPQPAPVQQAPSPEEQSRRSDLQDQLMIAFSQIKSLNKKMDQIEAGMEVMQKNVQVQLEPNNLKEPPANPEDYSQKLLKLAEHIIVLEKEVSRLKGNNGSSEVVQQTSPQPEPPASTEKKPPMPL